MAGLQYTKEMGAAILPTSTDTAQTQKSGAGWLTFLGTTLPSLFGSAADTIVGVKQADALKNQPSIWQQMGFSQYGQPGQPGYRSGNNWIWLALGGVGLVVLIIFMAKRRGK